MSIRLQKSPISSLSARILQQDLSTSMNTNQSIKVTQKKQTSLTTFSTFNKITNRSKEVIDEKLLMLFVKDLQPFSIVEDCGFKNFIHALNPAYQLPSRQTISRTLLPALYEECLCDTREIVKSECSGSDSSHKAEDIASELLRITKEWDIHNKISLAVSDNASTMLKAIQQLIT
ncbi:hypothetical protein J437_LFUL008726 [Ladona fulva]|uniref:Uncharacterized protein n=1 Tax=Ladona fulva TaxID=123851 RepID=A0A8K0K5L5_LADFU|nr:hypothetical protein J437_LFUL008726 [Ladona fulva]